MRNTLTNFIAFAAGAAIGSAVAWRYLKKHYERIADEEIDSMRKYYLGKQSEPTEGDTESEAVEEEPINGQLDIKGYADMLQDMEYTSYSDNAKTDIRTEKEEENTVEASRPYVISPEEFAERKDYESVTLTYYRDKVLADDYDEVVENVDELIGEDALSRFGEYEEDAVFVRDDDLKRDYEILRDKRRFADVVQYSPRRARDEWDEMR